MRLLRLGALFGSLMLLAYSLASVADERGKARDEHSDRAVNTLVAAQASVSERIDALRATLDLALLADGVTPALLRDSAERVVGDATACLGAAATDCTDQNLFSLAIVGDLTAASIESATAAAGVDESTSAVVVVSSIDRDGVTTTGIIRASIPEILPDGMRLAPDTTADKQPTVEIAGTDGTTIASRPVTLTDDDGRRTATGTVSDPLAIGSLTISASVDAAIGFAGDATGLYVTLLVLSTTLLALAASTFLTERDTLERRATTDDLTDLVNRREFERIATEEIERSDRLGAGACVMVVDLNGFKEINDTHGHQFGDLVLKAVSERLVSAVRDTDVVARWGGDEFVILLPGLEERSAVRKRADRISDGLAESPVVGDVRMQASIGAAIFPRHGNDLDALIRSADVAMYGAKTTGVGHRIADTIDAAGWDVDEPGSPGRGVPTVTTSDYVGPDRRRTSTPPLPETAVTPERPADPATSES